MVFFSGFTDHRKRATLTLADRFKAGQIFRLHGQNITFLGFVTPDLQRRHARFIIIDVAQFEVAATATIFHQFGESVGQTTGTHVMDKRDRVVVTQLPAAIDYLLTTALDLRVATLY